ncbi:MAG: hypothetical protein K9M51_03310 [Candidatus Gracilibacteria bacterium]|nr:hypothetical protein [Candidatus Gracilibacteria bacterium]
MLENKSSPKTLILLDGNALMHRAYHGLNKHFVPVLDGEPVGMVYGFASTLLNAINYFQPDLLVVTFDTKEKTFRHEMDHEYKAHRVAAPDDFYAQIPRVFALLESFELPVLKAPGFESDDLIGTLTLQAVDRNFDVKILSGDLDFTQLVSDRVKLVKLNGKIEAAPVYGPEEVESRYGLKPEQMVDFKAIVGDSSDNYAGVPGIGPKTAEKLLQQFGTLQNVWQQIESVEPASLQKKLLQHKDQVEHCQSLAGIHTDVPVEFDWEAAFHFAEEKTDAFFEKMKFHSLRNRYQKLIKKYDQKKNSVPKKSSGKPSPEEQMSLFG